MGDGWSFDGVSSTPNTGECPSVAVESSLSSILEAERAGEILFERTRLPWDSEPSGEGGKALPPMLWDALMRWWSWQVLRHERALIQLAKSTRPLLASFTKKTMSSASTPRTAIRQESERERDRAETVYALRANGIDRALTGGCNGARWRGRDVHAQHDQSASGGLRWRLAVVR